MVGVNSIAMYVMEMLLKNWTRDTLQRHLGEDVFHGKITFGGETYPLLDPAKQEAFDLYVPTVEAVMVGMMFWLILLWMYRQKFFVRIYL